MKTESFTGDKSYSLCDKTGTKESVFVHGKFQEHKFDLNAFNQSLIINALNHHGDAESNLKFCYWIPSSETLLS